MTNKAKYARFSRHEKLAVAKEIVSKAKLLLAEFGNQERISGHQVAAAQIGDLKIMMLTPFSGVKTGHGDFRYQLEMWQDGIGKVFGACWDPQERWANEFECFRLVKGEWIDAIFQRQNKRAEF